MRTLITALGVAALLTGGTAARSMPNSTDLTPAERAEVQRLVPEATMLNQLSDGQIRALSQVVAEADAMTRAEARQAALDVIREQPWLLPSRPGAR